MWSLGYSRRRRAVLRALAAVGDPGMSLLALGVALDLSENALETVLDTLLRSGDVDKANPTAFGVPMFAPRYRLSARMSASPQLLFRS